MSRFGRFVGDTNGLVSTPALFLSKHASRRARAAVLASNGTRSVAPSPRTSRTSAVLSLSLRERSSAIVTAFDSANAFASIDRDPAIRRTVYALPRSSFHFCDWRNSSRPAGARRNVISIPSVERLIAQPSKLSDLYEVLIVQGPDRHSLLFEMRPRRSRGRSHRCLFRHALPR
jgi:hypothetical protein